MPALVGELSGAKRVASEAAPPLRMPAIVGELARIQGALVPGRLITSAKSWLCHPSVDRQAAILPWAAPQEVERRSPVDVSTAFLTHLAEAFRAETGSALADCDLVITVPASFDEVARELTVEAARRAGLERLTLLEEPQAAFYSWLADHGERKQSMLVGGETVLVCDIGGGTTDFTVITVEKTEAGLSFQRAAVGDHLLLGGDNMDLALARLVEKKLPGGKLDAARFQSLIQSCRVAKEKILAGAMDRRDAWTIHLAGRGRGLIGGALQTELDRREVEETILDGFFPRVGAEVEPARSRTAAGLREFGLPYEHDPSVTAHLAAFLRRHHACPDAILFNGGVLTSPAIRERILDVLATWHGRRPQILENDVPDLAVARGAAYYALVRRGEGVKIAAGAARACYVEIATGTAPPAVGKITVMCLAARGDDEGGAIEIPGHDFELLTNRPVKFRLLSSTDRTDAVGAVLTLDEGALAELPPIVTVLRFPRSSQDMALKVHLQVQRSELGTLDVHLVAPSTGTRWKLAFDLRAADQAPAPATAEPEPSEPGSSVAFEERIAAAAEVLCAVFDKGHKVPIPAAQAMKDLTAALGADRGAWPTAVLRRLWEPLKDLRGQRGRSAEHEARWLNLVGYCLRPGYGFPLDDWRVKEAWRMFNAGLVNDKDNRPRLEWWILWRRVSGGLTRTMQDELGKRIFPHFLPQAKKGSERKPPSPQEAAEMWRVVGSLERIHREEKWRLGDSLLPKVEKERMGEAGVWALGRLGARVPLYGPIENVVNRHKAEKWVERLLVLDWTQGAAKELAFATAEIARASGDRARDLDESLRQRVAARLATVDGDGARLARLVLEPTQLEAKEERAAFGEALPIGLRLTSTEGRAEEEAG
ncbi:MAG: molecular chaperone DnaK [Myxococcales bacterium]|nr:molecular chaperone DnaK [Myxococcales bacterium]